MSNANKPIIAIQIYYEQRIGAEREVLKTFFTFIGCLVRTTPMSAEDMLKQHKTLVHPENKQTTYLFLTDRYPGDAEPAENELWCAFSIKKQELIINNAAAIQSHSSVMQFGKEALDNIILNAIACSARRQHNTSRGSECSFMMLPSLSAK